MGPGTETKRRGRPKDKQPIADTMTEGQKEELKETQAILAQIRKAAEADDPEIDGLTVEDVLRGVDAKKDRKRYYKLLAKGKIINDENANEQIEGNALLNIKRLKKESKAISAVIRNGKLPDAELANLKGRLIKIDKAIKKEKERAAELMRRLEN
jgi:hypothetical protein